MNYMNYGNDWNLGLDWTICDGSGIDLPDPGVMEGRSRSTRHLFTGTHGRTERHRIGSEVP